VVGYQLEGRNASKNPISHSISRATRKRFNCLRPSVPAAAWRNREGIFDAFPSLMTLPSPERFFSVLHNELPGLFCRRNSSSNTENHEISVSHTRRFYFTGNKRRWHSCTCNGNNAETTNNAEGKLRRELKRPFLARYFWKRFIGNVFFLRKFSSFHVVITVEFVMNIQSKLGIFFLVYISEIMIKTANLSLSVLR